MAERWEQAAREDLAPKVASSAYVMAIAAAGDVDPKQALEIGYAILLDKPIVVVVPAGREVPPGLARLARRVVRLRSGPATDEAQLHGQYVDVEKMPPSVYRDLAERHRFYSVPEVCRLTGRHPHALTKALLEGRFAGVKRGPHWYVPAAELPLIARRGHLGRADGMRVMRARARYDERLESRRNRRKGVAA